MVEDPQRAGPRSARAPRERRLTIRYVPLVLWFLTVAALMGGLAISHWFALPHPDKRDAKLAAGVAELTRGAPGWAAVHVLYTECRCSQRILDHLLASDRPRDVHETVVLVGDDPALAARLAARGYRVVPTPPAELTERYGIEGVPLLIVADPERAIRYVGGYTRRLQGPDISDLSILHDLRSGVATEDLPVFGCAVSQRLKRLADPLAIKR